MKNNLLALCAITFLLIVTPSKQLISQCFLDNGILINTDGTPCVNTVVTGVPFLRIVSDARSGAMGDVGIATSTDPNGIHHNAAKLAFTESDFAVSVNYTPWLRTIGLSDVYLGSITALKQVNDISAVGLEFKYFDLGSIQFSDQDGQPCSKGNPNEFSISSAYSRQLSENLSVSVTGKYVYSNLAAGQTVGGEDIRGGTSLAADVGLLYKAPTKGSNEVSIGLALSNLGSKIYYTNTSGKDYLPANLGLGIAYELNPKSGKKLTLAVDVNQLIVPIDPPKTSNTGMFVPVKSETNLMYSFGAEYWWGEHVAIRTGYFTEKELNGTRKYITTGLGFRYEMIGLNLSYLESTSKRSSPLDNTFRVSLLFDFDS